MIPIAKPFMDGKEAEAAAAAISSGWVAGGPKVLEFESEFAAYVGSKYAVAVSNCTTALHLALIAVGVGGGDVVITVSHSFIATASSVRHAGAEPVFIDIDPGTYNMTAEALQACLENECAKKGGEFFHKKGRVAAVLLVHQMGMPCDMSAILRVTEKYRIPVVEDAACAIGSRISLDNGASWDMIGKPHGDIACFSFHPRKVITTGEGGMITTGDAERDRRMRLLRQHGMSVSDLARHGSKKVVFEEYLETGYNYRMTDIQAAIGIEQLRKMPRIIRRRREIGALYSELLGKISWLGTEKEPAGRETNWQSYPVRVLKGAPATRDKIMQILLDRGVSTRRGIMNAHEEIPYRDGTVLVNSEEAKNSVILLPIFHELTDKDLMSVADILKGM
ncbi:MAG: DegT/DnrJ/EryC1/StrS family aminotransferase [Candidatus Omnitrophica bacterium]|nr:DegT/DnrJ/EryC1/StrS family aminotransferase [Candidatus Omnitrophota bacterium]